MFINTDSILLHIHVVGETVVLALER